MLPHGTNIRKKNNKSRSKILRVLLDSGASSNIILSKHVSKRHIKDTKSKIWQTSAGNFTTKGNVTLDFKLPEFSESKEISLDFSIHDCNTSPMYDIILGRESLQTLAMIIDFDKQVIIWDDISIPMKDPASLRSSEQLFSTFLETQESEIVKESTARTTEILDAHYEKADLN